MYEDTVVSFSHPDLVSIEDPLTQALRSGARRLLADAVEAIGQAAVYLYQLPLEPGGWALLVVGLLITLAIANEIRTTSRPIDSTSNAPEPSPERPITAENEDRLDRSSFVDRLCHVVVNNSGTQAKGIVIGLTGPWGSGKSSILNLLELRLKARFPGSAVMRFDPWRVSASDDLISRFMSELRIERSNLG